MQLELSSTNFILYSKPYSFMLFIAFTFENYHYYLETMCAYDQTLSCTKQTGN